MDATGATGWRPWLFVKLTSGEIDASSGPDLSHQDDSDKRGVINSSPLVVARSERPTGEGFASCCLYKHLAYKQLARCLGSLNVGASA